MQKDHQKAEVTQQAKAELSNGAQCNNCGKSKGARLNPLPLALAAGLICGLGTLSLGWSAALGDWGLAMVRALGSVYQGYSPSITGGIWGGLWGFIDGFFSGLFFAYLYNFFSCCLKSCQCCKQRCKCCNKENCANKTCNQENCQK